MDLTEKQRRWLSAALIATSQQGPVFSRAFVRQSLKMPLAESSEVADALQKEALVTLLPGDEAILTDKGRAVAMGLSAPGGHVTDFHCLRLAFGDKLGPSHLHLRDSGMVIR